MKHLERLPIQHQIFEDINDTPLAKDSTILKRWTEYCKYLYNHQINPDISVLNSTQILTQTWRNNCLYSSLKEGKSPGIDNIPSELVKYRGNAVVRILTTLCQKSWSSKIWPSQWTKTLIIPVPKKVDLKKCKNYRSLSVICYSSKILLYIILKRKNPQVEEI